MTDKKNNSSKTIPIGIASEKDRAFPVTISMRAYFSTYHLWAAKDFARQAKKVECEHSGKPKFDIRHRALVINSILSSVAFAEAAINEVFQDASDQHHSYIGSLEKDQIALLSDYWGMTELKNKSHISLLDKYQLALRFCGKNIFKKGKPPYQGAQDVIDLRNTLVHYKPESISLQSNHKLSKKLQGKFAENSLMDKSGNPHFPDKCLGCECARWSWKTMEKFVDSFFDGIGIAPNYKKLEF